MGCSLFSNSHFQMGITVMGFAEHFGLSDPDVICLQPYSRVYQRFAVIGIETFEMSVLTIPISFFEKD